jgi:hypothetical protein
MKKNNDNLSDISLNLFQIIMNQQVSSLRTSQIDANHLDEDFNSYNWEIFS